MLEECIHGLPPAQCDICTPQVRDEDAQPTPVLRRAAGSTVPRRRVARRTSLRSDVPETGGPRDITVLRAHHVTHLDNLSSIIEQGELAARAHAEPVLDVSADENAAARAAASGPDGVSIAERVPFLLTAEAHVWKDLRAGAEDARWSAAARRTRSTDYVVFVVPVTAFGDDFILADGDAARPETRYAAGVEAANSAMGRLALTDPELLDVELLAGARVRLDSVAVIGVANARARGSVKDAFAAADVRAPRIAVFPPWFVPTAPEL